MIYADDYDNLTEDLGTERKFKEKMDLLREDNLMVNDDKAEDTIHVFFYKKTIFCLSLNFLNIMLEIRLRFS